MLLAEKLKTLLYIIAQSVPFKPNYTKIGRDLNMHRNAVSDLMIWLAKAGLINILRNETQGISLLGKVNKIYLSNPNIAYLLSDTEPDIGNIRETFFFAWLKARHAITASDHLNMRVALEMVVGSQVLTIFRKFYHFCRGNDETLLWKVPKVSGY